MADSIPPLDVTQFGGTPPPLDVERFSAPLPEPSYSSAALKGIKSGIAGLGEFAAMGAAGAARIAGRGAQDWAFEHLVDPTVAAQERNALTLEESQSVGMQVAHGVGSFLPTLALGAGAGAIAPLAEGALVGARLVHGAGIAAATMGAPQAIDQATAAVRAGDDLSTAYAAGGTAGVMNTAMGLMPLSLKGGMLTRTLSGAASGLALGEVQRDVMNRVFDQHPDQQTPFTPAGAITSAVIGGMLGGILGPRPDKTALAKAKEGAQDDLANPDSITQPAPPAEPTAPTAQPFSAFLKTWVKANRAEGQKGQPSAAERAAAQQAYDAYVVQQRQQHIDQTMAGEPRTDADTARANDNRMQSAPPLPVEPAGPTPEQTNQQTIDATATTPPAEIKPLSQVQAETAAAQRQRDLAALKDQLGTMSAVPTKFGHVGEFADLLASERADLEQRRTAAAEAALAAKQAQARVTDEYLRGAVADTDARTQGAETQRVAAERAKVVSDVLNDEAVPLAQKTARIQAELAHAGQKSSALTTAEAATVQKHADVAHAFKEAWHEPLPSLPNEMDVYGEAADKAARETKAETLLAKATETAGVGTLQPGTRKEIKTALAQPKHADRVAAIDALRDKYPNAKTNAYAVLETLRETINPKREVRNAVQEPSTSSVLQHAPQGAGEAGGERGRVEPVEQGTQAAAEKPGEGHAARAPERFDFLNQPFEHAKRLFDALGIDYKRGIENAKAAIGLTQTVEPGKPTEPKPAGALSREELSREIAKLRERFATEKLSQGEQHQLVGKLHERHEAYQDWAREQPKVEDDFRNEDFDKRVEDSELVAHAAAQDQPAIVKALRSGDVATVLAALKGMATPGQQALINALQKLGLKTEVGYSGRLITREGTQGFIPGQYRASRDAAVIHQGGAEASTVLHELTHAATLARVREAASLFLDVHDGLREWRDLSAREQQSVRAYNELMDMLAEARGRAAEQGVQPYGLTDLHEFLAEAHSNPEFQAFLKGPDGSLWQRFVGWVKNLLGVKGPATLLDQTLTASKPLFGNEQVLTPEILNKVKQDFDESPAKAAGAVDATVNGLVRNAQTWASKVKDFASLEMRVFKSMLGWQTVGYIQQRVEATPGLAKLVAPLRALTDTHDLHRRVLQELEDRAAPYARALELHLHSIKDADARRKLSFDMMSLAGESSRLGVYLRDDYATNLKRDAGVKEIDKGYFDTLRRQYMALDRAHPEAIQAIEKGAQLNRDMYTDAMATRVASIIRANGEPGMQAHLVALDFRSAPGKMAAPLKAAFDAAATLPKGHALRAQLGEMAHMFSAQSQAPYFHLGRSGDYFVRARFAGLTPADFARIQESLKDSGKVLGDLQAMQEKGVFFRIETAAQADAMQRTLNEAAQGKLAKIEGTDRFDISSGKLAAADNKLSTAAGISTAMRSVHESLLGHVDTLGLSSAQAEAMKQAVTRDFLSMLPETSSRKALMRRQGVPGYEGDFLRNFTTRMSGMVQDHASGYTVNRFSDAFSQMREAIAGKDGLNYTGEGDAKYRAQSVLDELALRHAQGMQPIKADAVNIISSLGHSYYLALSPAFLLRTMAQPFHRGLPIVGSRFGFVKSGKEIMRATPDVMQIIKNSVREGFSEGGMRGVLDANMNLEGTRLSESDKKFMTWMHDMGEWNIGQSHQLARMAMGRDVRSSDITRFASMTAQYAEMMNRMVVGLAAYRMSGDMAYAKETTRRTMDTFEPDQTARQIGKHGFAGKVTPLMTAFMNYSLQTTQQIARTVHDGMFNKDQSPQGLQRAGEARKEFAGLMATTMTLAGAMGLPFVSAAAGLYNWLAGDRDHPKDVREDFRNFLSDTFGKEVGEVLAHGASRAGGVDLQTTGLQNLLPGSEFLSDRRLLKDRLESQAIAVLGPALNAGIDIAAAGAKISDGYYMKGLEQALPSGLKAPFKAAELATVGYTDSKGNPLSIKATPWDVLVQSTGFAPAQKAERTEASMYLSGDEAQIAHRKQVVSDQIYKAVTHGDAESTQAAFADMAKFNAANPLDAVRDLQGVFRQHAMVMATGQASGTGVGEASARKYPKLQNLRFANVGGMP